MYSRVHGACTLRCRTMYFEVQECVLPRPLSMYFQVHRRDRKRPTPSVLPSPPTVRRPSGAPLGRPTERDGQMGLGGAPSTAYCRRPSSAPHNGQAPARPAELPSPTTPNPDRTTRPRAAVLLTPSFCASSPSWDQSSSSSLIWASCLEASNRGRGDMPGQFTTSPRAIGVRVPAVSGTLLG